MKKRPVVLALILTASILFGLLFIFHARYNMRDFEVNYTAGKRLMLGETLYRTEDGHYMFKYFPSSAVLYAPLALLPLETAKGIWYALILICSVSIVILSYRLLPEKSTQAVYLLGIPPLILIRFFLRELDLGQINSLLTVVLLISTALIAGHDQKGTISREVLAGSLCGLAVALKPYALVFFPYLLVKGKWKAFLTGIVTLAGFLLWPSYYYGFQGNIVVLKEWFETLNTSTPLLFSSMDNISFFGLFAKWTGNNPTADILALISICVLAFIFLVMISLGRKLSKNTFLETAILLICIPLVSPLGWAYNFLMAVPGIMLLVQYFRRFPPVWKTILAADMAVICFSFFDLLGRDIYESFMNLSIITVCFLLILGYLMSLRIRGIA